MRLNNHVGGGIAAAVLAVTFWAAPVHATVHEIVAQWCSGHDELDPPGISDPTKKNFAQPLNANGFIGAPVFNAILGGLLVTFNFDHPASKTQGSGIFIRIGFTPGPNPLPIFIQLPEPDPDFPAFQHCPRLNTL